MPGAPNRKAGFSPPFYYSPPIKRSVIQGVISPGAALREMDMDAVSNNGVRWNSKSRRRRFYDPRGLASIVDPSMTRWSAVVSRLGLSGEHPQHCRKRQYGNYRPPHVRVLMFVSSCRGDKAGDCKVDRSILAAKGMLPFFA
jgi:hypothetical protein